MKKNICSKKSAKIGSINKERLDGHTAMFLSFLISLTMLNYQVTLTRIFSALFAYHYAFLVTSTAVAGTVIGSVAAHMLKWKKRKPGNTVVNIPITLLVMGVAMILSLVLIFAIPFTINVYTYVIFVLPVFIFGGLLMAFLFDQKSGSSHKLYFSDLFGAGIGSLISILLLNKTGIIAAILLSTILIITMAVFLFKSRRTFYLITIIIAALAIIFSGNFLRIIENNFNAFLNSSEGKSLWRYKSINVETKIDYTRWNAFSRTDVIDIPGFDDFKTISIDGTGNSLMYKFNGNLSTQEMKKTDNPYFAFSMSKSDKVALIGSGGGGEIIYPLLSGCKDISAVEINSSTIEAARNYKDYNGDIYGRPEVKVFSEDGRHFISRSSNKFDVIFLSLVMTEIATQSGFMLSEDFIYTKEAFGEYFRHLSENGRIAIVAHEEPEMYRLLTTIIQVLKAQDLSNEDIMNRIAILNYTYLKSEDISGRNEVFQPLILVKNKPITYEEARQIYDQVNPRDQRILYLPHFVENGVLKDLKTGSLPLSDLINNYTCNIQPVSDDKPYFRVFDKKLPADLLIIAAIVLIIFIMVFRQSGLLRIKNNILGYFTLIGFGFMLIEIPLISKLTLFLGHPIYGYSCGISILLVSAGIGSLLSPRVVLWKGKYYLPLIAITLYTCVFTVLSPNILNSTLSFSLPVKFIISLILITPLGLFMGMPFPHGLSYCNSKPKYISIPAVWSVNGLASVIGSMAAVYLSICIGYSGVLFLGAIAYAITFFCEKFFRKTFSIINN